MHSFTVETETPEGEQIIRSIMEWLREGNEADKLTALYDLIHGVETEGEAFAPAEDEA